MASTRTASYKIKQSKLRLLSKLGSGVYGNVYLAKYRYVWWKTKKVAVKEMTKQSDFDHENIMCMMISEFEIKNVVHYFGYSFHQNRYQIVMEYFPYGALDQYIYQFPLDPKIEHQLMVDITIGVESLHSHHIVHRDIKSPNVLVDAQFHAKLCDFGFAKLIDAKNDSAGSYLWMAPEVMQRKPHTTAADIFSLVLVFYEILAKCEPYNSYHFDSVNDFKYFLVEGNRLSLPFNCPKRYADIITLGWMDEPQKRPTAKEILDKLNEPVTPDQKLKLD